jgi:hypothetical protein
LKELFRMAISRSAFLVTCALLAAPAAAGAQAPPAAGAQQAPPARDARDLPVEVSPFASSGGDTSGVGVSVRWPFMARLGLEFEAEYRHTQARPLSGALEDDGVNGNVNLVFDLPAIGRVRPFLLGGGGLEHYSNLVQPDPHFLRKSGMSFVVNAGGGVRVPINDRFGIRTELRWTDGWTEGWPGGGFRMFYGATVGVGGR